MKDKMFLQALENYRYGVEETLPGYMSGRFTDSEAIVDEMALILDSRDTLAESLAGTFRLMQSYLATINRLDRQLLELKDDVLERLTSYVGFRQGVQPPPNHWWYYLDEVVSSPPDRAPVSYWLPLTPRLEPTRQSAAPLRHEAPQPVPG